jgi:DNA segregation ATPase FtsK/SpoIIIE-like protein
LDQKSSFRGFSYGGGIVCDISCRLHPDHVTLKLQRSLMMSETTQTDRSYDAAMYVVLAYQRASVSLVQRYLRVGYQRAVHLLQEMERRGVVGPLSDKFKK